ncbi:hypothetical protein TRIP_B350502 [uncultured Desulfatiglans sp.]|uniref:Uncharacterized protein n=1 Tax=Uncultured Desulfatiglans sp. TaxID=1748965 RepID=A0A653AC34_UNCDX|nr:hypothetical protein TRIP_B350502 [uncultured Desulfatiglans sp.]
MAGHSEGKGVIRVASEEEKRSEEASQMGAGRPFRVFPVYGPAGGSLSIRQSAVQFDHAVGLFQAQRCRSEALEAGRVGAPR